MRIGQRLKAPCGHEGKIVWVSKDRTSYALKCLVGHAVNKETLTGTITRINYPVYLISDVRLKVEPYPSEERFKEEFERFDVNVVPILHIDICHDFLSTVELFNLIKNELPPLNLSKTELKRLLKQSIQNVNCLVSAREIYLHERSEQCNIYPQIEIWYSDVSKSAYKMWVNWCKRLLKKKAVHVKFVEKEKFEFNPYEGLRFRVRVEFHD